MPRQMILLYGVEDKKKQAAILKPLLPLRLAVRFVSLAQETAPLGVVAGWLTPAEETAPKREAVPAPEGSDAAEPMLIMSGLQNGQIDQVLSRMRMAGFGGLMKAVLTPINMHWDAATLRAELQRERDSLKNM